MKRIDKQDNFDTVKKKYIYNHTLANWLIRKGIMPCGAGIGARGDNYVQFVDNEIIQKEINNWNEYFKK